MMKLFLKELPQQVASTFTMMMIVFLVIGIFNGVETMSIARIIQFIGIAIVGGALQLVAFSDIFIEKLSHVKRLLIFILPFGIVTFLFAAIFNWFSIDSLISWSIFFGIFIGCFVISLIIFEVVYRIKGEEYTVMLMAYREKKDQEKK